MSAHHSKVLVLLCNHPDSIYAKNLLAALNALDVEQIHVIAMASTPPGRSIWSLVVKHRWGLPVYILQMLWRKLVGRMFQETSSNQPRGSTLRQATESQGGQYFSVSHINGEACQNVLKTLQVDLAVLAGAPIVRAPILEIPTMGTLNAHQGALPQFRGMNVIEWALLLQAEPSLSIHFVNPGVDTGDILAVERISITQGDTIRTVRERASARQTGLLAETAVAVLQGNLQGHSQTYDQGLQYYTMHPTIRNVAEAVLKLTLTHKIQ